MADAILMIFAKIFVAIGIIFVFTVLAVLTLFFAIWRWSKHPEPDEIRRHEIYEMRKREEEARALEEYRKEKERIKEAHRNVREAKRQLRERKLAERLHDSETD